VVIALLMVGAFAVRTRFRAAEWADAERFARATIASGGTSPRMLAYFAQELGRKGRLNEQEQVFRKALALYPEYMTARINLGLCLQKQGRNEEARALLDLGRVTSSVQNVPRTWNAALNLAGQHHKEGRSGEALALIRDWRPQFPETWELVAYEATILRDTGSILAAVAVAEQYARNHWWHLPSQLGTAALQREAGHYESALALARRAQRLDIRGAAAFAETARNELALGRLMEALESQAEAIARAPRNAGYLDLFAGILHALGREQEALATRRRAATLAAEDARALL
jgi:tetratricopeptide (TPR) repeat protein